MNTTFKIKRKSGTYAELLETYGLANLLNNFMQADNSITIHTVNDSAYEIRINKPLPDNMLEDILYFPLFKYIKTKLETDVSQYSEYYDYPELKTWKKERQELLNNAYKETDKVKRENEIKRIETLFDTHKPIPCEFDVVAQFVNPNVFSGFNKMYQNFFANKDNFSDFINEIIRSYSDENHESTTFDRLIKTLTFDKNPTATQLLNPNQGKGLKAAKANSVSGGNFNSSWISETMKISGALSDMICQLVKVGTSYDLKVFVPEYKDINYESKTDLIKKFKKRLKGKNTPVKIDILNILLLTQLVIDKLGFTGRRRKVKDIVSGLHSVYQKDLGQNKAVINIGFMQVPDFIEISNHEEVRTWIEILEEQRSIIGNISELGNTTQGLLLYRDFISGGNIYSFFEFSFWYAQYLTSQLSNKKYAKAFSIETLNKFYNNMDTQELNLIDIINNGGFKAIANAIRESTIVLQTIASLKKQSKASDWQIEKLGLYSIRYGVAQALQSKSKTEDELVTYIGDFISCYNSETALKAETKGKSFRPNVRENDLQSFFTLVHQSQKPKLIGALLASYGFALLAKENQSTIDVDENVNENIDEQ